ncbi:MAG: hypothetical protein F6J93_05200 [Oscillatoria sp. SIO1A7]|nr:hypothetical protein [Oscillatoria sp. SIO1A7]
MLRPRNPCSSPIALRARYAPEGRLTPTPTRSPQKGDYKNIPLKARGPGTRGSSL